MPNQLPIIAIVGEPNVGKSTLLNKMAGGMRAVTSDVAGTTRDRQYIDAAWNGVAFTLLDTAGVTFGRGQDTGRVGASGGGAGQSQQQASVHGGGSGQTSVHGELETKLNQQIDIGVAQADFLLFIVDGKQPAAAVDRKALLKFRKIKKPVVLVINKIDGARAIEPALAEFQRLGIKPAFAVSALTGRGLGDLLDYVTDYLKEHGLLATAPLPSEGIAVAICGKPNVGKSSLFNRIIKEERVVVSPVPGTTRTAIDSTIKYYGDTYIFIDTAGLKKKIHRQEQPDVFGGFQTYRSMRRSDVVLLVIDAIEEITKQDQHIAQEIFKLDKGLILVATKIDLYRGKEDALRDYISLHFPFFWMSPLFLVSGKTGAGIDELLKAIKPIYETRQKVVGQAQLDVLLEKTLKQNPPKLLRDQKKPKVLGLRQTGANPPAFELLVNHPAAISAQYRRYLEKAIIKSLDFWGTPIILRLRGKDKK